MKLEWRLQTAALAADGDDAAVLHRLRTVRGLSHQGRQALGAADAVPGRQAGEDKPGKTFQTPAQANAVAQEKADRLADPDARPSTDAIIQQAQDWVDSRKAAGWTRADFVKALGALLAGEV